MVENNPLLGNSYVSGVSATSASSPVVRENPPVIAQPKLVEISSKSFNIDEGRYGSGKPRRIIIRGKISSD
ncbi:hypothetical protein GGD83_003752 [Rhodoblastus sphagnicola]|uniref:hypothetical protein n=1 Tax=Rhodoblastus sphagnicola TaxID=333368 RepID=UPI0011AFE038|nr:hypothetical protein [Rhodoblastus sphagnicola]MBB4199928.1 hypothetical protein [Rhodoblastus sphagnicola]